MENLSYSIFVVGKNRGKGVYRILSKKKKNVYHFTSEEECLKSLTSHTRIVIIEDSLKSMSLLEELSKLPTIYTIFMSNHKGFSYILSVIRKGICDYIIKDSYLYYSILKSIKKAERTCEYQLLSSPVYFDTCSLKESYPIRFKIANWLSSIK